MKKIKKNTRGFSLMELTITIAIFMLIAPTVVLLAWGGLKGIADNRERLQALALAEEGLEAVRNIRDYDWDNLTGGAHGLTNTNGYWEFSGSYDTVGDFTRQITVSAIDDDTREVNSAITWGASGSVVLVTRLTQWKDVELSWVQTTVADFQQGSLDDNVVVTNTAGGELALTPDETEGTYTSIKFNTGIHDVGYQTISWTENTGQGTVKFRIKTSNSEPGLNSAPWRGSDGTTGTYYTTSNTPIITSGQTQWIQYIAYFEGTENGPIVEDITITYQP